MKDHPILFSSPMVRAIIEDRKTQTRRVIAPTQPRADGMWPAGRNPVDDSHYGHPGDRLWVRETWAQDLDCEVFYAADHLNKPSTIEKWRPSIFMPRRISRITLEITDIRVERLQDISEEDAIAEGIFQFGNLGFYGYDEKGTPGKHCFDTPKATYRALWNSINGKKPECSYKDNPWVWVLMFKRIVS